MLNNNDIKKLKDLRDILAATVQDDRPENADCRVEAARIILAMYEDIQSCGLDLDSEAEAGESDE
jgi:hypothetical protein